MSFHGGGVFAAIEVEELVAGVFLVDFGEVDGLEDGNPLDFAIWQR